MSEDQTRKFFSVSPLTYSQMGLFILIELLLIFGESFSKFHVVGPLHLYDLLLFLLTIVSFFAIFRRGEISLNFPLLIILFISFVYLVYSIIAELGPIQYMIRQYALFLYIFCIYTIVNSYESENSRTYDIRFIILIGLASILIQFCYHIYGYLFVEGYNLFGEFNYFTKMAIMGIIVSGAYIMIFTRGFIKILLIAFYIILSMTLGHASAFLASLACLFFYLFMKSHGVVKIGALGVFTIVIILLLVYAPDFSDTNTTWRLVYWKYTLKELILDKYALFGKGFGGVFLNEETLSALRSQANSPWMDVRPEEQYLSPSHNSFISIAHHIGILPSILLAIPLFPAIKYSVLNSRLKTDKEKDFLILAMAGLIVWASFNVVLELPHSSAFFWLVYFNLLLLFPWNYKVLKFRKSYKNVVSKDFL